MSLAKAKTIEIFLPDGDPKSIRVASITSRTVEVTSIPRTKLDEAKKRENLHGVGVYILVGTSEEHSKPEVYIGEAESTMVRLAQHNASKDFWQYALVITSRTNQFTKTHVKYLEWLCYDAGKRAGRCVVNNVTVPTKSYVSEPMEADLHDSFETLNVLVATLGLPLFTPARSAQTSTHEADKIFTISRKGIEGQGIYTEEGFVVLAGSKFNKSTTTSFPASLNEKRKQMLADGLLVDKGEFYELMEDTLFASPSYAGTITTGRSTNGWTGWKLKDGRTLSDVYRKEQ